MKPRLIAAFFLLFFGACLLVADLVLHGRSFDGYTAMAVGMMLMGAVFTEPSELTTPFKVIVVGVSELLPWARKRKSTSIEAVKDEINADVR